MKTIDAGAVRMQKKVRAAVQKILPKYVKAKKEFAELYREAAKHRRSWTHRDWQRYYKMHETFGKLAKQLHVWQSECRHFGHPKLPHSKSHPKAHCPWCHCSEKEQNKLHNLGVLI